MTRRNQMADLTAKQAAQGTVDMPIDYYAIRETSFHYSQEDLDLMDRLGLNQHTPCGVFQTEEGKLILPSKEAHEYLTNLHYLTHLGAKN